MNRLIHFVAGILVCLVVGTHPASAASRITATITFTNSANLYAASYGAGASVTANSDARAWTNTITSAATQVPITASSGTNIAQQVQLFLSHVASYPFTGLTPASDGSTYVSLRGTNDQAVAVTVSPSTAWVVSYVTNTVGTGYALRLPITVETATVRTNLANYMLSALAYGTDNPLIQLGTSNATVMPIRLSTGLVSLEAGAGMGLTMTSTSVVFAASGAPTANSVWVSKSGVDSTGARGSLTTPFLTLTAAKTNAVSGDTIFVLPGTYAEQDLLKDGVNWHFFNGAVVTNTSVSLAIFQDNAGALTSTISGDGQFTGDGSYLSVVIANASTVKIRGKIAGGNPTIQADNGTLTIDDSEINSDGLNQALLISGVGAVVNLNRCRIVSDVVDDNTVAIAITAANNDLTLRDCVIITGGTNSVTASGAVNARLYGSTMSNVTNHANVTWLTGSSRFEVSTDVR